MCISHNCTKVTQKVGEVLQGSMQGGGGFQPGSGSR
jgi:hypothetical protein